MISRGRAWLRLHARAALCFGGLGAMVAAWHGCAPGGGLDSLARALEAATGVGARVDGSDVRWEPSAGAVADAVLGRRVLFLARRPGEDTRDVWRARARVSPEGDVLDVSDAHDLTNTPLGDDHALVVNGVRAAFATRAYGQEQSVTALDLDGEGTQNKAQTLADRVMAAITNLQQTGALEGLGRVDVTLESPAAAVGLVLGDETLAISLYDRESKHPRAATLDLARGELAAAADGVRADASMHLPKRFSHWTVDTLRAVPWIGPAPIAWIEDQALTALDTYRRLTFHANGEAIDVVATADPPPPVLDTSQASVEEAHWPPPNIPTMWKEAEEGEGVWTPPDVPWIRKVPGVSSDAPAAFYRTFVRPDDERPYVKVLLVAMDLRQLDLDMEAGVEDPEPLTGSHGNGRIPRDPAVYKRVAAAFNGAFKTEHGHYGMMVHKRVLLPPVPGAATVATFEDGRVGFGTWGADRKIGGIVGVPDDSIVSFRQNLDPLIDHGQVNPTGRNLWGFTLPGKGVQTERTGLCVTTSGHLLYAWGDDVSATTLAKAMKMAGCDYAMHLDMNPYHTGFLFTAIDDLPKKYKSQLLTSSMSIPTDRYIQYSPKDFFYVMVHDPTPPAVDGGTAWEADGGAQPPPHWMPGIWTAHADVPQGSVELLDVEAGRATWRVRAGTLESPAATPLRELTGDDARHVLLAAGAGVALEKHPRCIATDGRIAVPVHGGAESGVLLVGGDGRLSMMPAADAPPSVVEHGDLLELPLLVWDGAAQPTAPSEVHLRAAVGMTAGGRIVLARGTFASDAPLAEALIRVGCTRALVLDRGAHATAFVDRAGTANAPRGRYDETVLYAIASPMRPRGFRFDPSTLVASKH